MANDVPIAVDVLILGGGVAGLWTLDTLRRAGYCVLLLEAHALGAGQTIASQGIIHGGLKYTLDGLLNPSADAIRDMPQVWRDCLAGGRSPTLVSTRVRAEACHLWRTDDWSSQLGMLGARLGLRVRPEKLARDEWPEALRGCPGAVFRLNEQVVDCARLLDDLGGQHRPLILAVEAASLQFSGPDGRPAVGGNIALVEAHARGSGHSVRLAPRCVVLTAGEGNAELRRIAGLSPDAMQRRPLHMALARGPLPELYGHCTDGARTRVTITTAHDERERTVWQIGGQVAEDGVGMSAGELVSHVKRELALVLPGIPIDHLEWSTYRVDRAEAGAGGKRPSDAWARREGNVITVWPTKLALAPRAAEAVLAALPAPRPASQRGDVEAALADWPRPPVAKPPWETPREWHA